jgi:hypothetical protein
MKRIVVALLIGLTVFGAVWGLAASISVSATNLGAGSALVASCDDAVSVNYTLQYTDSPGEPGVNKWRVTAIDVTGISEACNNQHLYVILTKDGVNIGDTDPQPPGGAALADADTPDAHRLINEKPAAADVNDVHVLIQG